MKTLSKILDKTKTAAVENGTWKYLASNDNMQWREIPQYDASQINLICINEGGFIDYGFSTLTADQVEFILNSDDMLKAMFNK